MNFPAFLVAAALAAAPADSGLRQRLEAAGFKPRFDAQGQLEAIHGFRPAGRLDPARWDELRQEPTLRALNGASMTASDLRAIAAIESVEELVVGGDSEVRFDSMQALAGMPRLRSLHLHHLRGFDARTFKAFRGNRTLRRLQLHNLRPFDPAAFVELAELKGLEELHVTALLTTAADLAPFRGHPTLATVVHPVTLRDLDSLLDIAATLPRLRELFLLFPVGSPSAVSDEQVSRLAELSALAVLRAVNLGLTAAQIERLGASRPGLRLELLRKEDMHGESRPYIP